MLFSRKNAALVAAFLAPSALAQQPASCANGNTPTFDIRAIQLGAGPTVGDLALQAVVDFTQPCTATGANGGGAAGFRVTALTGTLNQAGNAVTGPQVTYLPANAAGDTCFYPCQTTQQLSTAGLVFASSVGGTNGGNQQYRVFYSGTPSGYTVATVATPGTPVTQNAVISNSCNAPSAGAAVCDVNQACTSTTRSFYTFTGTDANGLAFTANVGIDPVNRCATNPAIVGQTTAGYQVQTVTGNYGPQGRLALTGGSAACFYPCSGFVVDSNGIPLTITASNTGAVTASNFGMVLPNGNVAGSYRIGTGVNAVTVTGTSAQSCPAGSGAFFAGCAVSSSAARSSSAAAVSSLIPSVVIPSVTLPTGAASSAVAVTTVTTGVTSGVATTSGAAASSVVVITGTASASATTTSILTGAVLSSTVAIATPTGPQTSVPTPFLITVTVRISLGRKRQAVQYVGDQGVLTTDPAAAAIFSLVNGQLFSDGQIVSTGPQIPAQQPLDGGAQGTVTTLWTSTNGAIAWTNAVFANGAATFCVANNVVNTVFVAAPAVGCTPVALTGVAVSAVIPAIPSGAAAGGITINNNFNPTIGVIVTVNLVLGTSTLNNGSVITTTGLSSTTSPLYATASNGAYCLPCHMSAVGAACPSAGNVVYTTACGACTAYTAAPAVAVTCNTCVPVTLPAAAPTAAPAAPAAPAGNAAAPAGTAGAAPVAPAGTFTGSAAAFGVEAAAVMVAGAALLL